MPHLMSSGEEHRQGQREEQEGDQEAEVGEQVENHRTERLDPLSGKKGEVLEAEIAFKRGLRKHSRVRESQEGERIN